MRKLSRYAICGGSKNSDRGSIDLTSIYSKEFVESVNIQARKTVWSCDYINEIFMFFYLRIKECASVFERGETDDTQGTKCGVSWSACIAAARAAKIRINPGAAFAYHFSNGALLIISFLAVLASALTLPSWVIITKKRKEQSYFDIFSVIRNRAAQDKMKYLVENEQARFFFDDLLQKNLNGESLYARGSVYQRLLFVIMMPYLAIRDYFLIIRDSKNLLGWQHTGFVISYFCIRIAHKCAFEYFLDLLLEKNKAAVYYTGNKEDRFAVLEMRLCRRNRVKSVCIPHGIEYSFKVPAGLAGDVFYCTTSFAQKHLSELYGDDSKFIYDGDIVKKMFSRDHPASDIDKIVFFPESREPEINLSILQNLVELGISFSVKLHIRDNPQYYNEYSDKFSYITDFDAAISNKICLARKSTVLVEAIYNNSIAIAVLTDPKDRAYVEYMFPSLQDSQIKRVYTFEALAKQLDEAKNSVAARKSHILSQEAG